MKEAKEEVKEAKREVEKEKRRRRQKRNPCSYFKGLPESWMILKNAF